MPSYDYTKFTHHGQPAKVCHSQNLDGPGDWRWCAILHENGRAFYQDNRTGEKFASLNAYMKAYFVRHGEKGTQSWYGANHCFLLQDDGKYVKLVDVIKKK